MKFLSSYKLFEASTIKTDKSFKSVVQDILADLTDEGTVVEILSDPPLYTISINSAPNKIGLGEFGEIINISPNLIQLISFLEGDYSLQTAAISTRDADYRTRTVNYRKYEEKNFIMSIINKFTTENPRAKSVTQITLRFCRSNESIFKYKLDSSEFHLLHSDSEKTVVLDKYLNDAGRSGRRVYYINFKNSKIGALKLVYDLNSRSKQNFRIYDNYNTEIDFNKLDVYLMKNDMKYGTFNDAWYYIENDFNNQGYTSS